MYAVIETGSKQYSVRESDIVTVEKIDKEKGETVTFKPLLYVNDDKALFGTPYLDGIKVLGTILEHKKDKKVIIFKYKHRDKYRLKKGHRQDITVVKITRIQAGA